MPLRALTTFQRFRRARFLSTSLLAIPILAAPRPAAAQRPPIPVVQGYITAVHLPASIEVNRQHILLSSKTILRMANDKAPNHNFILPNLLRTGSYVFVFGPVDSRTHTVTARKIRLGERRWRGNLSGLGMIDKVISTGTEPVFRANGFRIRITPKTTIKFSEGLKSLADVATNTWLRYEGKLDNTGTLIATEVRFIKPKFSRLKAAGAAKKPGTTPKAAMALLASTQRKLGSGWGVMIDGTGDMVNAQTTADYNRNGLCGSHWLVNDRAMQERVNRVGQRVVPAYQKQLAPGDRSKIPFRFFVVTGIRRKRLPPDFVCNSGIIFVSRKAVARLKNDGQLATLLADGVTLNLQKQWAHLAVLRSMVKTAVLDGLTSGLASPTPVAAGMFAGGAIVKHEINLRLQRQRARIALGLMADAGYNPWQAPEAWRLLEPKHLPRNPNKLKYPALSQYQIEMLDLEYRKAAPRTPQSPPHSSTPPKS